MHMRQTIKLDKPDFKVAYQTTSYYGNPMAITFDTRDAFFNSNSPNKKIVLNLHTANNRSINKIFKHKHTTKRA